MVSKEGDPSLNQRLSTPIVSFNRSLPSPNPLPLPLPLPLPHLSSPFTEMASMHAPPYGQSLPGIIGPPYSPSTAPQLQPNHSSSAADPSQEPQSSNQYPQYSYDIQLRYPNPPDSSRPYSQPHLSNPPRMTLPPMSSMTTMEEQQSYASAPPFSDTTGQVAPPGSKPRVTATLWEDEGTLCFQVDVNGTCVARREDNHMINGTKLLNVVGMTRGRRDGLLKSEKVKHVVKIGPMHLKGVWIPYDRALSFANKEKITESLYPLFVHNIGALLYHPSNQHAQALSVAARGLIVSRTSQLEPNDDYSNNQQNQHQQQNQNENQNQNQNQTTTFYGAAPPPPQGGQEERSVYS